MKHNLVFESKSHTTKDAVLKLDGREISKDVVVSHFEANAKTGLISAKFVLVPEKTRIATKAMVAFETEEPRYSVAELEKIAKYISGAVLPDGMKQVNSLIAFLKDTKTVEKVLNGH